MGRGTLAGMASTGEPWRLGHRPALDGLRGVAVTLVVLSHTIPGIAPWGPAGVTVFFTLSGFLITALLLEEHERTGAISLRAFYRRRVLRLGPALVACAAGVLAVGMILGPLYATGTAVVSVLLYAANWSRIAGVYLGALDHAWSLAVEEQFYLLWPLLLIACLRRGRRVAVVVTIGGIVASWALRAGLWDGGGGQERIYYGADTHGDALLVGCLLALGMMAGREVRIPGMLLGPAAAVLFVPWWWFQESATWLLLPVVVPVASAVLVSVSVSDFRDTPQVLLVPVLRWLGRRSYAIYLWHWPVAHVFNVLDHPVSWPVVMLVVVAASLILAELSWRFVETPFLRLKNRGPLPAMRC